jgi:WD40 repeat protein
MAEVFISYARTDQGFARDLNNALQKLNRDTWIDWRSIPDSAQWRAEIFTAIDAADNFLFIISPDSLSPQSFCGPEVAHALDSKKRIITILYHPVDRNQLYPGLGEIQWINYPDLGFEQTFERVIAAINTDREWVRAHTRLKEKATEWDSKNRDESFLLRGMDLQDAVQWLAQSQGKEPPPTALQIHYIQASRAWEAQEIQRLQELHNRALARQLAVQAELVRIQPHSSLAHSALLAVESLERLETSEANLTLRRVLSAMPVVHYEIAHDSSVGFVAFSPDGKTLATATWDGVARLFDAVTFIETGRFVHGKRLRAMVFSPDSRFLATASDNTARISRVPAGDQAASLVHEGPVYDLAFSPDSRILASCGWSRIARLTDTATGIETGQVSHKRQITQVSFSPDGRFIVTASGDRSARITDLASGGPVASVRHKWEIKTLAVNPNGRALATSAWERVLRISSMRNGRKLAEIQYEVPVTSAVFSPDGRRVATTLHENTVCISDIVSGKEVARVRHRDMVFCVTFSSDGGLLGTTDRDGIARVSLASTGAELKRVRHDDTIFKIAFDASNRRFATAGHDRVVRVWGLQPDKHEVVISNPGDATEVVFLPDGQRIATAIADGRVCISDAGSGAGMGSTKSIASKQEWPLPVTIISPDRKLVASSRDNKLSMFDMEGFNRRFGVNFEWRVIRGMFNGSGTVLAVITESSGSPLRYALHLVDPGSHTVRRTDIHSAVRAMAFSPDDRWLAFATWDRQVRLIDPATGAENRSFAQNSQVNALRFHPDGKAIAVALESRVVQIMDSTTGKPLVDIRQDRSCHDVLFSPDGKTMAVVTYKGVVCLYNSASGTEAGRIRHDADVHRIAFSEDGFLIASASGDHTALVSDAVSGREVARIIHNDNVAAVAFSPDGRLVASTSRDGTTRIVTFRNDDLIREARSRLTRHLTAGEWKRYVPDEDFKPVLSIGTLAENSSSPALKI